LLTLASGRRETTAIFSRRARDLLRPPVYPEPERIMVLMEMVCRISPPIGSGAHFLDCRATASFAKMAEHERIFFSKLRDGPRHNA